MFYIIQHNSSGWYYDILDHNGCEIVCEAYFLTYDAAKLDAERSLHNLAQREAA